jgi:hypothetical protein
MVIFSFPHLSAVHIPTFCGIPSHTPPPDSDPCFVGACGFAERIWYRLLIPLPGTLVIGTIRGANFVNPAERRHPLILDGENFLSLELLEKPNDYRPRPPSQAAEFHLGFFFFFFPFFSFLRFLRRRLPE